MTLFVGVTSGQSNLTSGPIAAAQGWFSRIRRVTPICTAYIESQKKCLQWQRPLVAGYRQYLHFVGRPLKPPQ